MDAPAGCSPGCGFTAWRARSAISSLFAGRALTLLGSSLTRKFVGIHRRRRLEDFARAVLERVAFSLRDCFELVNAFVGSISKLFLIGGGANSQLWSHLVCDVLGRRLLKPGVRSAAHGAAMLAGIATGLFRGWSDA